MRTLYRSIYNLEVANMQLQGEDYECTHFLVYPMSAKCRLTLSDDRRVEAGMNETMVGQTL